MIAALQLYYIANLDLSAAWRDAYAGVFEEYAAANEAAFDTRFAAAVRQNLAATRAAAP